MKVAQFLENLRHFGELEIKEGVDEKLILATYADALTPYDGDILEKAFALMMNQQIYRTFPLLAECLQACEAVQEQAAPKSRPWARTKPEDVPWLPERIQLADRLLKTDLGRQAAQEEWVVAFHDFCRENARLPNKFEAEAVRSAALQRRTERLLREAKMEGMGGVPRIIRAVSKAMAKKRARLTAIALEDAA